MARFVFFVILLAGAGIFGTLGLPKVLVEHALMQGAIPIDATVTDQRVADRNARGNSKKRRYDITVEVSATLPSSQTLKSEYIDPTLARTQTFRRRSHRDACSATYAVGNVVQAWYVPADKLPAGIVQRLGSPRDVLYLRNRYSEEHVTFVGLSVVLAGIALAVLGNKRSVSSASTRAVAGSDPPVREVQPRHTLWASAVWRTLGAVVTALPVAGLGTFLYFGAAGEVPAFLWWMLAAMAMAAGVLVLMAIADVSTALAFEQPKLFIEHTALHVGRNNLIAVTARCRRAPVEPISVMLSCTRMQIQGSGKQQQVVRVSHWTTTLTGHELVAQNAVAGNPTTGGGYPQQDAWQLAIPPHLPATTKLRGKEAGYEWMIVVKQRVPGRKLEMQFPMLVEES